jgi:hypothetical protein
MVVDRRGSRLWISILAAFSCVANLKFAAAAHAQRWIPGRVRKHLRVTRPRSSLARADY